ncbi:DUF222 domain-containing protein [Arthrobacter sp. MPF02]|uniref:HNH endonuclease signature motif containing protein n=1 Tax=Arthrobacter sp. MPF02 TaxID=3388492 RepID=UPI003984EAF1
MEELGDQLAEFGGSAAPLPRFPWGRRPFGAYYGDTRRRPPARLHAAAPAAPDVDRNSTAGEPAAPDVDRNSTAGEPAATNIEETAAGSASGHGHHRTATEALKLSGAGLLEPSVPDSLDVAGIVGVLAGAAAAAPEVLASAGHVEASLFAGQVEELSRTVEYLQILAAGAVDRTRTQAITDAAAARARQSRDPSPAGRTRVTGWNADGVDVLNETDTNWPGPAPAPQRPGITSPVDDGCRNTAEFLRLRLRIPVREARRRLILAAQVLPRTAITGDPLPPTHEHLATALTPTTGAGTDEAGTATTGVAGAPVVSSHAATIITATLDRLRHHTSPDTLDRIEHQLTTTAATADPDFLTRVARRWADTIDADGIEPPEETLRHTQGLFIRKPRHGLHHLEIFATTGQYEYLATAMNTATNPRTQNSSTPTPGTEPELDLRSRPQRQLDGILSAVQAGLITNQLPATGGNRPQIIATINYRDLFPTTAKPAASTGTGDFAYSGPVPASTLRKIACDADIIPALLGTHGEILDLGRKTRLFTTAQRLALTARDQGCAFPNCTAPAPWCEAHHITYWSHHGPTTTDNGVLLCSHHHHLIHKEQWTITTHHNTPTFIPPPHIDPSRKPQQNHYFKPPPHPRE